MNTQELDLHFAVIGRHHGDEEDTMLFVRAPSSTLAMEAFKKELNALNESRNGMDIYVNHVLCSLTPLFESDADAQALHQIQEPELAERVITAAKQHGDDSEPEHEVGDLQDVVRAMWHLMAPHQRVAMMRMPEVQQVFQSAYMMDFPNSLDQVSDEEIRTALANFGLDPEGAYPDQLKLDAVMHSAVLPGMAERYVYCDNWPHGDQNGQQGAARWALDTGTMQIIDAQFQAEGQWHTLSGPDCKALMQKIQLMQALNHRNQEKLGVHRAGSVADFPDWVGSEPQQRKHERPVG